MPRKDVRTHCIRRGCDTRLSSRARTGGMVQCAQCVRKFGIWSRFNNETQQVVVDKMRYVED